MPKGSNLGCRSDQSSFARYWIMKKVLGIFAKNLEFGKGRPWKIDQNIILGQKRGRPPCPLKRKIAK